MFCLFYDAAANKVCALNGSGRATGNDSLEEMRKRLGLKEGEDGRIPVTSVHAVTTPGAAAGWVDTVARFGSGNVSLAQILQPAIELAENGYPVSELTAYFVRFHSFIQRVLPTDCASGTAPPSAYEPLRPTAPNYSSKMPPCLMVCARLAPAKS